MRVQTFYTLDHEEIQALIAKHIETVNDLVTVVPAEIEFVKSPEGNITARYNA